MRNQPCYDADGRTLGWFSRSIAVAGFIFGRNRRGQLCVLANRRGSGTPIYQGYWNCPCGFLDFDERCAEAMAREVKEETGVELAPVKFHLMSINDDPLDLHQNITFRYSATVDVPVEDIKLTDDFSEKDEVSEIKWIPITELDQYKWAFNHENLISEILKMSS